VRFLRALGAPLLTLLVGGFLTLWMVRSAPGYGSDASELDGRRSAESVAALRAANRASQPLLKAYVDYVQRLAHGDLGISRAWGLPVAGLLSQGALVTAKSAGAGLLFGWFAAVALAFGGSIHGVRHVAAASRALSSVCLCVPAPALAIVSCLLLREAGPEIRVALTVAVLIAARTLLSSIPIIEAAAREGHVLHARARGVGMLRLSLNHILRRAAPALAALLAAALPLAFAIAVPVETVCNLPGAGQLAWLAAQKRDMPLLTAMTMALLTLTLLASALARSLSRTGAGFVERRAV
jgi:peptide/nickel transport system permease protein